MLTIPSLIQVQVGRPTSICFWPKSGLNDEARDLFFFHAWFGTNFLSTRGPFTAPACCLFFFSSPCSSILHASTQTPTCMVCTDDHRPMHSHVRPMTHAISMRACQPGQHKRTTHAPCRPQVLAARRSCLRPLRLHDLLAHQSLALSPCKLSSRACQLTC